MDLTLLLSIEERNDNTALILTDVTSIIAGGWGVNDDHANFTYTSIDNSTYGLELVITVTTSDNTETTYDAINLYTKGNDGDPTETAGGYDTQSELVFTITAPMLKESGVSAYSDGDELPDGIYEIAYNIKSGVSLVTIYHHADFVVLVYGQVKNDVYESLRALTTNYDNFADMDSPSIRETMFKYAYLKALATEEYLSRKEEALNVLYTLERMVINDSSNSW
jgi:hypothetical protein